MISNSHNFWLGWNFLIKLFCADSSWTGPYLRHHIFHGKNSLTWKNRRRWNAPNTTNGPFFVPWDPFSTFYCLKNVNYFEIHSVFLKRATFIWKIGSNIRILLHKTSQTLKKEVAAFNIPFMASNTHWRFIGIIWDDPGPKKDLKPTIFALRATFFAKMGKKKISRFARNFFEKSEKLGCFSGFPGGGGCPFFPWTA